MDVALTDVAIGGAAVGGTPLGVARDRVLRAVLTLERDGEVTVEAVAALLGGHPNTSRNALDALTDQGLLTAGSMRIGRGRPRRTYALTNAGRVATGTVEQHQRELLGAFATHLGTSGRPGEAEQVGRIWGRAHARRAVEGGTGRVEPVLETLRLTLAGLGFDPAVVDDADGPDLLLLRCPLLALSDDRDFACRLHEGFLAGTMEELQSDTRVELRPFAEPRGCHVAVVQPPGLTA